MKEVNEVAASLAMRPGAVYTSEITVPAVCKFLFKELAARGAETPHGVLFNGTILVNLRPCETELTYKMSPDREANAMQLELLTNAVTEICSFENTAHL